MNWCRRGTNSVLCGESVLMDDLGCAAPACSIILMQISKVDGQTLRCVAENLLTYVGLQSAQSARSTSIDY